MKQKELIDKVIKLCEEYHTIENKRLTIIEYVYYKLFGEFLEDEDGDIVQPSTFPYTPIKPTFPHSPIKQMEIYYTKSPFDPPFEVTCSSLNGSITYS